MNSKFSYIAIGIRVSLENTRKSPHFHARLNSSEDNLPYSNVRVIIPVFRIVLPANLFFNFEFRCFTRISRYSYE